MYRRDVFLRQGGLDVGPGEDLEFSLRLRRLGYLIRFVPDAWAETAGPASGISLLRQRARWDRDALRVRFMMYGELRFFHRFERLPDTLQRLDFIVFDLIPTLSLPFYLAYIVLLFGGEPLCFSARSMSCCSGFRSSTWRWRSPCSIDPSASLVSGPR